MAENRGNLRTALRGQLIYKGLVIVWQVGGKGLEGIGLASPGPSPSFVVAGVALLIAGAMVLTANRMPLLFATLSLVTGFAAMSTILNAFVADPALWPSDLARYAGVVINVVGVAAAAFSLTAVALHFWRSPASAS